MDPLSHAVLGTAFAMSLESEQKNDLEISLRPTYGLILLSASLTAMAPDLDSLIRSDVDQLMYVEYHRHFTHSLFMIPVISFVVSALLYVIGMKKHVSFFTLWKWGTLSVATHGFLDACTSYGTHLLWPIFERRESWSIISIIDPIFTLPLLVGVLLCVWKKRKIFAQTALIFSLCYLLFGVFQHFRARHFYQMSLRDQSQDQVHWIQVKPTLANLLVWRALSLEGENFRVDGVRLGVLQENTFYRGSKIAPYLPERITEFEGHPIIQNDLRRFKFFSEDLLYIVPQRFSGEQKWVGDLRYSLLPHSLEPLWVVVLPQKLEGDAHLPYQFTRNVDLEKRKLFLKMLTGEEINQAQLDAF